jgi:hypothetical protein
MGGAELAVCSSSCERRCASATFFFDLIFRLEMRINDN